MTFHAVLSDPNPASVVTVVTRSSAGLSPFNSMLSYFVAGVGAATEGASLPEVGAAVSSERHAPTLWSLLRKPGRGAPFEYARWAASLAREYCFWSK
jgi:hypothetical protein